MLNSYYSDKVSVFLSKSVDKIIGEIATNSRIGHNSNELFAWEEEIKILKDSIKDFSGNIYLEFSIPRMGRRVDCILIIKDIVFVIEFKVGEEEYLNQNIEQVWDYALDLKNFHKTSHDLLLVPILLATHAKSYPFESIISSHNDKLLLPIRTNKDDLKFMISKVLHFFSENLEVNADDYIKGSYSPTPTIIEAAISLYNNHQVEQITRSDADAKNLNVTTQYIADSILEAKTHSKKIICFVTGVPGAGKTLVGLKVATEHLDNDKGNSSVFLSGNKPLVDVLQEALARDQISRKRGIGLRITKKQAHQSVKAFIQIIHHYRDAYLRDSEPPYDHIAIFDEAQRAWSREQTVKFMRQKKGIANFQYSEPEFLISCLDRHKDWAVIICLVGGGQEINTGEAGISEWLNAIMEKFPSWETRISPNLNDSEYSAQESIKRIKKYHLHTFNDDLHLSVSMRSFRAENLSRLVKEILDIRPEEAAKTYQNLRFNYPIVLTRDLKKAKEWLKEKARGSERYGLVVSSQAYRLKPLAIDVRSPINHINWFLDGKDDVRSSFYLEDAATEFQVQGLELDWSCITWDGDFRYSIEGWKTYSFVGTKWQNINKVIRKKYLINAYRVLLTRGRQGLVIVVPEGDPNDQTRLPEFYDDTFEYLSKIGLQLI